MLLTHWDGVVSAWDLLRRQHEPVLVMQVCDEPLLAVTPHEGVRTDALSMDRNDIIVVGMCVHLNRTLQHI